MMMALGMFVFSLQTAAYQELQRKTSWRYPSNERVGARAAYQYTGPGEDSITLSGWIAPDLIGTGLSLDVLRTMADMGRAWTLIEGTGRIYGTFVIPDMTEGKTHLNRDGAARRIDFSITLTRVDEGATDLLDKLGNINDIDQLADLSGLSQLKERVTGIAGQIGTIAGKYLP